MVKGLKEYTLRPIIGLKPEDQIRMWCGCYGVKDCEPYLAKYREARQKEIDFCAEDDAEGERIKAEKVAKQETGPGGPKDKIKLDAVSVEEWEAWNKPKVDSELNFTRFDLSNFPS